MSRYCLVAALALLAIPACLQPDDGPPETEAALVLGTPSEAAQALVLPVEVMPTDPAYFDDLGPLYEIHRTFDLSAADVAALVNGTGGTLWLQGHALGYRDGHSRPDGKASVQLNGGPWVRLENNVAGIAVDDPELAYDGIGGGFRTVRLTIDHPTLCGDAVNDDDCFKLHNTIAFRFHGTDGASSGYRIIDLDLITAGDRHILAGQLPEPDPQTTWPAVAPGNPDILAGERLWRARNSLYAGPDGDAMIASCSDCHAQDGTDLEYFAFSDRSIITRSVFHGLSAAQGAQIATYIRNNPAVRRGRPWNPPYQPGRLHDDNAPDAWAAGQGLEAVLDAEDATMLDAVFPNGRSTAQIIATIKGVGMTARTINLRKIPIAIQLPDWNAWLPEIHPLDLWGVCAWENAGDGTFGAPALTATGDLPAAPVIADLDGDDAADLITTYYDGNPWDNDDGVRIQRGVPAAYGTWEPATTLPTGGIPADLAVVDLDGDRDLDLLVADSLNDRVLVMLGTGHGAFAAPVHHAAGDGPVALATGDFDDDGDLDVAAADTFGNRVTVLLNDGLGALTAASSPLVGNGPKDVVAGDLDGDGVLDLAVASYFDHKIGVLIGDGTGGFADQVVWSSGNFPKALAIGDLDGDLDQDLAALAGGAVLTVMTNDGHAGFTRSSRSTTEIPQTLAIADLDRDGRDDVVTVNRNSNLTVNLANVYLQRLDGTLADAVTYNVGGPPGGLAIGDTDHDFAADLVVTTGIIGGTPVAGALSVLRGTDCGAPSHTTAAPPAVYDALRGELAAFDRTDATQLAALPDALGKLVGSASAFVSSGYKAGEANQGGFRTVRSDVLDLAVAGGYSHELVKHSVTQWTAVKLWEVMREFNLETLGPSLYTADGETLEWPTGGHQSVFFVAPHLVSGNQDNFTDPATYGTYLTADPDDPPDTRMPGNACVELGCTITHHNAQSLIKGDYDSTAWYHLQMLLHAGARSRNVPYDTAVAPVDWPYVLEHIDDVPRDVARAGRTPRWESLRFIASWMKTYQMRDNGMGPALIGWSMRDISPRILVGNWRGEADHIQLLTGLDNFGDLTLRKKVTDAFLTVFLERVRYQGVGGDPRFSPATWPRLTAEFLARDDDRASWFRLDVSDYPATPATPGDAEFAAQHGMFHHADHMFRAIPLLCPIADRALVTQLEQWSQEMWPGTGARPNNFGVLCP